jgi:hypothetical protein
MSAVADPQATGRDPLAGRHRGGMAHDGDEITLAPSMDFQDRKTVFGIVKGDALD